MVLSVVSRAIIDDIIAKYGQVSKLNLSDNGIKLVENMGKMTQLEKLDLSGNEITDVEGVSTLENLSELNLQNNNISDVNCLGSLSQLVSLDISYNNIASLESLRGLRFCRSLSNLYLSGNPICQSPLIYPHAIFAVLPGLEFLDNRTLRQHMDEQQKCDPSKDIIDAGRDTPSPLQKPAQRHSSSSPKGTTLVGGDGSMRAPSPASPSQESFLRHKIGLLEAEIASYEKMFAAQEAVLGEAAKKAALRAGAVEVPTDTPHGKDGTLYRRNVSEFAFDELLGQWRKQVHKAMVQQLLLSRDKAECEAQAAANRDDFLKKSQAQNVELNSLRSNLKAANALIEEQQQTLLQLEVELHQEREQKEVTQRRCETLDSSFNTMRRFLESYRDKVDREMVASNVVEIKMTKKLMSMEGRLEGATKRIEMLATLLEQKEVQLRNSEAALLAERRLLWLRQQHPVRGGEEEDGTVESKKSGEGIGVEILERQSDEVSCGQAHKETFLSDIRITPEVEALLRALFRQLDPQDTGTVECRLVLKCLKSVALSGLLRCPPGSRAQKGGDDQDSRGMGDSLWSLLVHRLEKIVNSISSGAEKPTVTWGEFLLLLVPDADGHPDSHYIGDSSQEMMRPGHSHNTEEDGCVCTCENCQLCVWRSDERETKERQAHIQHAPGDSRRLKKSASLVYPRRRISDKEYLSLHHSKLMQDCLWAMVPLQLPSLEELERVGGRLDDKSSLLQPSSWLYNLTGSIGGTCSCVGCGECRDAHRLKREVLRLAKERAFLLGRIQSMGRSLERRAEGIKGFFDSEIRKGDMKLLRAKKELSEAQTRAKELEGRVQEMNAVFKTEKHALQNRVDRLEQENSSLRAEVDLLASRKDSGLLQQLEDQSTRCLRLESELRILRKELSKAEVANKAIQRDIMRHQSSAATNQDMLAQLQTQHVEAEQRASALLQEKTRLLQRVQEAEAQLESLLEVSRGDNMCDRSSQTPTMGESEDKNGWIESGAAVATPATQAGQEMGPPTSRHSQGVEGGRSSGGTLYGAPPHQGRYYSPPPYPPSSHQHHQSISPPDQRGMTVPDRQQQPQQYSNASASLDSVARRVRLMAEQLLSQEE